MIPHKGEFCIDADAEIAQLREELARRQTQFEQHVDALRADLTTASEENERLQNWLNDLLCMSAQIVYKLTDKAMRTHRDYQWVLGETRTFSGTGALCADGWAHAYTHPLLAVLLNPIHANFTESRLFKAKGIVGATDHGLKVGCSSLTLIKEMLVPAVTTEHRIHFAIVCALAVYADPSFVAWAENWLSGADRSVEAARAAAWAARAAAKEPLDLITIVEAACADLLPLRALEAPR